MTHLLSNEMREWLAQLGEQLRKIEWELETATYAVKEIEEEKSAILRKINFIHHGSHLVPEVNGSLCIVDFDVLSYLSKDKTASDILSKNYV